MYDYFKCFLIILYILNTPVQTARILSIFGFPGPSHYAFIEPLLKELAKRGHEITSITNYPQNEHVENFRDIVIEENMHLFDDFKNLTFDKIDANHFEIVHDIYNEGFKMCENILSNPTVHKIFATENFDLIILEVFLTEAFFGLSELLKAPLIGVSSLGTMLCLDNLVGNTSPNSFIPNIIFPQKEMNFYQRFINVVLNSFEWYYYYYEYLPVHKKIYEKYFPSAQISFWQAQTNFALVLVNDHFTLSAPRPYVPNMIEVAGLHIDTKPQPIPKFIKEILDNATEGVIFITTPSIISSNVVEIFLERFATLKHIVLWKTKQVMASPAPNVLINANFSTSSILAHPNVKLFLSQGGFPGIVESIYHGIPILGLIPSEITDDYIDYIKRIGSGLTLKLYKVSDNSFSQILHELLYTSYYSDYAKLLSKRFRDQETSPMERAIYWIEYVLRHDGAEHLRNKGRNLTWYQYHNIDVFILILILLFLLLCLPYVAVKLILKFCTKLKLKNPKVALKEN